MSFCGLVANNFPSVIRGVVSRSFIPKRFAYIVERLIPPPLSRTRAKRPRILKNRHFLYRTVEDTELKEPPDVHIVLTTFVDGVGDVGDVISLIPNYARDHFLLPQKAVYATPENIAKYTALKKLQPEKAKYSSIHSRVTMRAMSCLIFPVFMNNEIPWTVERKHIHYAFFKENYFVPEDVIELPKEAIEGPDMNKEGKDFAVFVTINNEERFPVRCRLFHIKPGLEAAKLSEEYYLNKAEPVLPDQAEILDEMPTPKIFDDPSQNISLVEKYKIQYISA